MSPEPSPASEAHRKAGKDKIPLPGTILHDVPGSHPHPKELCCVRKENIINHNEKDGGMYILPEGIACINSK